MPKTKIMVVEDSNVIALFIQRKLKILGYTVSDMVTSGEEAISLVEKCQPDLILMDITLQGKMDGVETAAHIHDNFDIPVIYMTSHSDNKTLHRARVTNPFGYLLKPFEEKELQVVIKIALSKHQMEKRLKEALEKEKELNELKSRFISIASHEFRTPLSSILASSNILKRYGEQMSTAEKDKRLDKIQVAVKYMTSLLDDVLTIGTIEAEKMEFHPTLLNVKSFCQDIVQEIQVTSKTDCDIIFSYNGTIDEFYLDEKLLQHIVTNLLSNAVKYSPHGGTVYFTLSVEQDKLIFIFVDEGIGIPPKDKERLFEPFHRAVNVGSIPGTGLGLAIVERSVELHGGAIIVDSKVGQGSTFTVIIPHRRITQ